MAVFGPKQVHDPVHEQVRPRSLPCLVSSERPHARTGTVQFRLRTDPIFGYSGFPARLRVRPIHAYSCTGLTYYGPIARYIRLPYSHDYSRKAVRTLHDTGTNIYGFTELGIEYTSVCQCPLDTSRRGGVRIGKQGVR